jgi:hypothetical protein
VPLSSTLKRDNSGTTSGLAMRARNDTLRGTGKKLLVDQPGLEFETRNREKPLPDWGVRAAANG